MTKSKMTDTNEQKWKEESKEIWKIYRYGDGHSFGHLEALEMGYLAARKKAHSEREDAFKAFTLDLADRYEKEIELLKTELKAERLQNDKTLEFIDKHDHIDISWFPLNFDLEEIVKNRRIVL